MIKTKVRDGFSIVRAPKCALVLTRHEFIQALRRGTWCKRRQALQAQVEGKRA
jgi:hypothetical protein